MGWKEFSSRFDASYSSIYDLAFPPLCLGCGKRGVHWCQECDQKIQPVGKPYCHICQKEIELGKLCLDCEERAPYYKSARALGRYAEPLIQLILNLKQHRNQAVGRVFEQRLAALVQAEGWEVDVVVPIPLSRESWFERGYNQVEMFSKPLARRLELPHEAKFLSRKKNTRSQVGLSHDERIQNLRDAFYAESRLVDGQRVLLVDDVMTSGASMHFAAEALKQAGAVEVYALALARANHRIQVDV